MTTEERRELAALRRFSSSSVRDDFRISEDRAVMDNYDPIISAYGVGD